ncbi:MAG: ribosome maturation factor RimP [Ekhidna sp.]|uniref:ribosome maturation factor RimP n=1 Tax=Ekhidna sp. TaxID=2608089 RepID=UPI0032EACB43
MEIVEEQKIREIANKLIEGTKDLFLVDVKIKGNVGNQKVLVFVDGDNGISIDQCSHLSRQLGAEMEEDEIMEGKYTLEVSSPGLDFPLVLKRQYAKNKGRDLEVELDEEKLEGKLKEINEDSIVLEVKSQERLIKFEEIKQSKVKVSFK